MYKEYFVTDVFNLNALFVSFYVLCDRVGHVKSIILFYIVYTYELIYFAVIF